jgi:hypothetical protein
MIIATAFPLRRVASEQGFQLGAHGASRRSTEEGGRIGGWDLTVERCQADWRRRTGICEGQSDPMVKLVGRRRRRVHQIAASQSLLATTAGAIVVALRAKRRSLLPPWSFVMLRVKVLLTCHTRAPKDRPEHCKTRERTSTSPHGPEMLLGASLSLWWNPCGLSTREAQP